MSTVHIEHIHCIYGQYDSAYIETRKNINYYLRKRIIPFKTEGITFNLGEDIKKCMYILKLVLIPLPFRTFCSMLMSSLLFSVLLGSDLQIVVF